jgi:predicted nucleic acid-binding Zn ribbon protein
MKNSVGLNPRDYERLYNVWRNMRDRCYKTNSDRFYTYGARGITVCKEWRSSFRAFAKWAVENGWNPDLSIERKSLDVGYCPENCTFITMKEQARNKTSNIRIIYHGEDKCVAEWCEILGINDKRTYKRYQLGIRDPEVLFYPGDLRSMKGCGRIA